MITDKILFIIDEEKELLFDGTAFSDVESKNFKDYFSAVTIPSSTLRTSGFKVPKSTASEKIEMQAEMHMYENGGLDPEIDVKVSSLVIPLEHSDENYVESYGIETSIIEEKFNPLAKKYNQIDLIFPPALSYTSLYTSEILDNKSDLFIYISEKESYAVIFKGGQYISTRVISTLEEIAEKINMKVPKLKEVLSTKGVKDELYSDDEFLYMNDIQEVLSKMVERIAHSIGHKRGVFKLETIDRIFLDFNGYEIPGFLDMFDSYGYESSTKEVLNVFEQVDSDMKHLALNALYALDVVKEKIKPINLSIYERKPSFLKTNVGQFSMVMVLAIILSFAYPIYGSIYLEELSETENRLNNDVAKMKKVTDKLQINLKKQRKERKELEAKQSTKILQIKSYDKMLDALVKFDTYTLSRQKMMKDVNKAMKKYKLSSKKLEFRDANFMNVQIIAKYSKRDNIAEFMKDLISQGYSSVLTQKVEKNETYYESFVEIHP